MWKERRKWLHERFSVRFHVRFAANNRRCDFMSALWLHWGHEIAPAIWSKLAQGAGYTSDFVCDFMCDLHANRRCHFLYLRLCVRQEPLSISFFAPNCRCDLMCDFVSAASTVRTLNRICDLYANRTWNRTVHVNGHDSVSDRELHLPSNRTRNCSCNQPLRGDLQQIASAIYSKSHMKSHTCNQPLRLHVILVELEPFLREFNQIYSN
jgi:hypothetical protein